jgi:hypothetical protein
VASKMAAHNRAGLWTGKIGATAPIAPLSERGTGVHNDMEMRLRFPSSPNPLRRFSAASVSASACFFSCVVVAKRKRWFMHSGLWQRRQPLVRLRGAGKPGPARSPSGRSTRRSCGELLAARWAVAAAVDLHGGTRGCADRAATGDRVSAEYGRGSDLRPGQLPRGDVAHPGGPTWRDSAPMAKKATSGGSEGDPGTAWCEPGDRSTRLTSRPSAR